ncbi:helix-turn-helix domain-containing protein [Paracoccus sp. pheM1]|uniref:helix-turn-helix domain-containing protein n=1 Tax=Paracoccus pantotrophus TaxID=82367 RepID=UPI000684E28F|nr:helix-turn-helix domain-containing protein [Paracoccus sp. pheM1]
MNLERLRRDRDLNQDELAEMAGVKQSTISKIEGGFDGVTLRVLKQIAAALEVEVSDLFADDRTRAEAALIRAFRTLSPERQQGWLDLAEALAHDGDTGSKQEP